MIKKAIILGSTSGIGEELARKLAENGFMVGVTGRRAERLELLKLENPDTFRTKYLDISDLSTLAKNLDELTSELGGLDLLVISSAIYEYSDDLNFESEKRVIDVNVSGFTRAADWAFHYFSKQNYGQIAAITSISGLRGSAMASAYSASKAFQINYLQALRQRAVQLALPIAITDIRPGTIDTNMAKDKTGIFGKSSARETATQIYRAIKYKRKMVYVTKRWVVAGFALRLIPAFIYNKMKV